MAEIVRYVDKASVGGDGTTQGHSGATAAYASLSAWEAAEQTDLVTATNTHTVYCAGSTADTTALVLGGWGTNATYFITIAGDASAPDSDGLYLGNSRWSTAHYRLQVDGATAFIQAEVSTVIDGLQIDCSRSSGTGSAIGLQCHVSGADPIIRNCRISASHAAGGGTDVARCISVEGVVASPIKTCVLFASGPGSANAPNWYGIAVIGRNITAQNCTIYGGDSTTASSTGVYVSAGTVSFINLAVFGCDDDFNLTGTIDYCASDDLDGTNSQDMSSGTPETTYWNQQVTDYTVDYSIKNSSSVLYNTGTATGLPATDIVGNSYGTNDIGAFAFVAAAGRIMGSLAGYGGLAGPGGLAGERGGLAA